MWTTAKGSLSYLVFSLDSISLPIFTPLDLHTYRWLCFVLYCWYYLL